LVEAIASQDSVFGPAKIIQLQKDIHNQNRIHHNQDDDLLSSYEFTAMCRVGQ